MTSFVSGLDVHPRTVDADGTPYRLTDFFGAPGVVAPGPQMFLVEPLVGTAVVAPHYHVVDQFQVFTGGEGRIGSVRIDSVVVHYADAYTPYGPIVASSEGFGYLTVRTTSDPGPNYLSDPEARARRRGLGGRLVESHLPARRPADDPPAIVVTPVVEPLEDGLAVHHAAIGPEQEWSGLPVHGAGRYYIVLSGSIIEGGSEHPRLTSRHVDAGEVAPPVVGASRGAEILVLSFPVKPPVASSVDAGDPT